MHPSLMFSSEIFEFFRSSHWTCFMKKALLENFSMFAAKLQACSFDKKSLQYRYFPLNTAKFLRTPLLKNMC